ncbi:MAG: alpha/beta hydrolase [Planctomycetaceae bacterium]
MPKHLALIGISAVAVWLTWGMTVPAAQVEKQTKTSWKVPRDAEAMVYKTADGVRLKAIVFRPSGTQRDTLRPAIVFFFGGGWRNGSPQQFYEQCRYFSSRGMLAISAEYRVASRHQARVVDCVADANSAIRWLRQQSGMLRVDPERIAAAGGSAGGHLAAAVAALPDLNPGGRPNALMLFNPALDLAPAALGASSSDPKYVELSRRFGAPAEDLSPQAHVHPQMPPTLILHGRADTVVPFVQAQAFQRKMRGLGRRCDVAGYSEAGHGFFNFGRQKNRHFAETMRRADRFLVSLDYLQGPDTVQQFLMSKPR